MAGIKHKRLIPVITNALFSLAPGIGNQLFSIVITRLFLPEWWGSIVELQLIQYLITGLGAWGNKEYLIREFSLFPQSATSSWNTSFSSRFVFLIVPSGLILPFFFPVQICLHLSIWIVCRFIAQSFESSINHEKKFTSALIVEVVSAFTVSAGIFLFFHAITFELILLLITVSNIIRALAFALLFPAWIKPAAWLKLKISSLKMSAPFMLLAFTGLVQTKIDLAVVDLLMPKQDLARYQVFTNFLVLIKTGSSFLLYPFLKNLYRLPKEKIMRVAAKLLLAGIPLCLTGLGVLFIFMHSIYQFSDKFQWYIWGLVCCLPGYWFSPFIFYLFKLRMEQKVILSSILGIVVNLGLCLALIKPLGISGALLSMSIAQVAMLLNYARIFSKINPQSVS